MAGRIERTCPVCGSNVGFMRSDDGYFYCGLCNSQADDIVDTGVDEEQIFSHFTASCNRVRPANAITAKPISQVKLTTSQFLDHPDILEDDMRDTMDDGVGPTEPCDFGSSQKNFSYDDCYSEIRSRYLTGLQVMIQLQCQALVEKFNVSPLIIGLVGPLWLRYLASTRIMADDWADRAVHDSEVQTQGEEEEFQPSGKDRSEPVNIRGKRVVYIWYRSVRSTIPTSCSLTLSFLVCHVAREAIMPSDILRWTLEGKLPYFAAFGEIEKQLGTRSGACPIRASLMFRPVQAISSQKLESMAAKIAQKIGLELPPVNFYAIAFRYCRQLSLPTREILPFACHICEWSTPSELYVSSNEFKIPTRVCVMSILIVTIRILFDINGYGIWESSLSNPNCSSSGITIKEAESRSCLRTSENADKDSPSNNSDPFSTESGSMYSRLSVVELLKILIAKYTELNDVDADFRDLESYLQYCTDVAFSGSRPSYEDPEEEKLVELFWDFYQSNKDVGSRGDHGIWSASQNSDTSDHDRPSSESLKDVAIQQLKLDMEENKFCYIPPRVKVKRKDYLHYARRRKDVYIYAVHADYYLLLRSCAKVAEVEMRIMHIAVLILERRLQWLEKRMDSSLHLEPNLNDFCDFCKDEPQQNAVNDPMDLSI